MLFESVTGRDVGAGAETGDADFFSLEFFDPLDVRPREHGKNQFVDGGADDFEVRAAEARSDRRGSAQRRDVHFSRHRDLGELGAVGNENDLVVQPFFGEEAGIVRDPDADVSAADGAVTDAQPLRGRRAGNPEENDEKNRHGSLHGCPLLQSHSPCRPAYQRFL